MENMMRLKFTIALAAVFLNATLLLNTAFSKQKPRVTIQVVGTQASERNYTYTLPGKPAQSKTTCDTNGSGSISGTTYGDNVSGTVNTDSTSNCTTTTKPATAPTTHTISYTDEYVRAIMPDGTHVTLWCEIGFRKCWNLQPGSYSAEIKGDTVWMFAHDLSGKQYKLKYKAVRN